MEAGEMEYIGETELLQYSVKEWRMEKVGGNMVKAVLKVQRIFVNDLFTTFIPACCLLLISYCTLFFKKEHFKTSLPVVITTLLGERSCLVVDQNPISVTYTLYTGVARALPPTSYVKAIEIYLLFHIMMPFIIFLLLFRYINTVC